MERLDGECLTLTVDLDPHVNPDIVADVAAVDLMGLVGRDVVTDVFVAMPCGGGSPRCGHNHADPPACRRGSIRRGRRRPP